MSKRRGFTLVEVLVVVAITTVVLGMVGGLLVFMTNSSRELIVKSEEIMLAQSIENHILGYLDFHEDVDENYLESDEIAELQKIKLGKDYEGEDPVDPDDIIYVENGKVVKTIFEDTGLSHFKINGITQEELENDEVKLVTCQFFFENATESYHFAIGAKPTTTP